MKIVAIVPARGDSKGVPGKNIRNFCGKPLIAWAIETALKSPLINRTIVSTDSPEIAKVAKKYGAETPFLRPKKLAGSATQMEPVLRHAIEWLKKYENYKTDAIVLLMPPNSLRNVKQVDEAIELFLKKDPDVVIPLSELSAAHHHPYWIVQPVKRGNSYELLNAIGQNVKYAPARRQLLPKYYVKNDLVFVLKPKILYGKNPCYFGGEKQEPYIVSDFYDEDINIPSDWEKMENKFRQLKKGMIK
ncbi:MAG: NeuA: N-acetylneuraminate cytidylyltransferase [Parcubacteria group bacterium GW2011_GWC1_43_61]|uniref:NeuA: N-acetylneuraminate cytidylyltransferase n=1 Tax=Candidatus Shapirobacteria bacterium GW2011_GWE1_38_92 TaxID=1618489 RepID=A0A0G0LLU7_9BACT|nr:MAG: NeuA: N-acetylneuraminate cytidylyltransferase [Candidatus Shapirobacteria bacterium GW2011_GWE1_38_92]KKR85385.1 MAG: NeuA: N-acetylneuraminate cytidylyltransferase [Candidatus Azambacteria bacterium GW2011_GWF1_41_10]KKS49019.1 MAG: NeuA: N-acetylneuraminate cytidylyltransferase [Candidatus Azambacteria bacterium GW2011_GWF2_42_22]KKS68941.1 MAG: NeuA: N-acetylneuraminate cytidylyltransferase [Candidatus Azambacteria bacterium GW2011_GWA2_42_62]KKS73715.1 MAG: NeuA: N-acetylneuraminat